MTAPDVLVRLAQAWESTSHALLLAAGWIPSAYLGGPWRDSTTDRTEPEHQALATARRDAERDPDTRHFAKALDALEESLLRASGWSVTAMSGGIAWRSPEGDPHTRAEGAAVIRRQLREGM
jgi:hypothetical protein